MTQSLENIRNVASARAEQLQKEIAEALDRVEKYRAELDPLTQILRLSSPEPSAEVSVPETKDEPFADEDIEAPVPRWSQYRLPPRYRRFLHRFAEAPRFSREDVEMWYRRSMNPRIQLDSLKSTSSEILRALSEKNLIVSVGSELWKVVR